MNEDKRILVRERYAEAAKGGNCCCGPGSAKKQSEAVGYSPAELASIPEAAVLGLGCGNPVALSSLKEGETVVDLGSGGGIDCFLAARQVGPAGKVIGVDMTPDMLDRARRAAADNGFANVEFRLGEIEHLPIADSSVDVILSNCVINLSPDKAGVFREAYRVLKPGGRLVVSDIVTEGDLPPEITSDPRQYAGCVAGAVRRDDYIDEMRRAGFASVRVLSESAKAANVPQEPESVLRGVTLEAHK